MTRLPTPGSDNGAWGDILNDFLAQSHDSSGGLKADVVGAAQLQDGSLASTKLDVTVQNTLAEVASKEPAITAGTTSQYYRGDKTWQTLPAGGGVTSVNTQTGTVVLTKADISLNNVDNTSDAGKPISTATQTAINAKATNTTVVHLTGAETITGIKTLTQPVLRGSAVVTFPGFTSTLAVDASLGNVFVLSSFFAIGNPTISNPTNPTSGQKIIISLKQNPSGGSSTVTWGTAYRFGTDVPQPTLSTVAGKTDYIGFIYNAADSKWDCIAVSKGY